MDFKPARKFNLLLIAIIMAAMLAACTSSPKFQGNTGAENSDEDSGTPAMVDRVNVEQREGHYYAVVEGFYPDPCTPLGGADPNELLQHAE